MPITVPRFSDIFEEEKIDPISIYTINYNVEINYLKVLNYRKKK